VELAQVVSTLCQLGQRPRMLLLERLLSLGPCPEYSRPLLRNLLAAVNRLLEEGGDSEVASNRWPPLKHHKASMGRGRWAAAISRDTLEGVPDAGAAADDYDAYVDAARRVLGARDGTLSMGRSDELVVGEDGQPLTLQQGGNSTLWQLAGMDAVDRGAGTLEGEDEQV
jgi:hypothetical protein